MRAEIHLDLPLPQLPCEFVTWGRHFAGGGILTKEYRDTVSLNLVTSTLSVTTMTDSMLVKEGLGANKDKELLERGGKPLNTNCCSGLKLRLKRKINFPFIRRTLVNVYICVHYEPRHEDTELVKVLVLFTSHHHTN